MTAATPDPASEKVTLTRGDLVALIKEAQATTAKHCSELAAVKMGHLIPDPEA